jgi:plasmid stabilization system protein ParE
MTCSKFRFIPSANADLDEIWKSIADDNLEAADRIIEAIYQHVQMLGDFPRAGHPRPDLASRRSLLFSPIEKYMVVYRIEVDRIAILGVLHAARDIPTILSHRKTTQ